MCDAAEVKLLSAAAAAAAAAANRGILRGRLDRLLDAAHAAGAGRASVGWLPKTSGPDPGPEHFENLAMRCAPCTLGLDLHPWFHRDMPTVRS